MCVQTFEPYTFILFDINSNEIEWSQSPADELVTICPNTKLPPEQPTVNLRYRCGYCHQTSNWKHVIEVVIDIASKIPKNIMK